MKANSAPIILAAFCLFVSAFAVRETALAAITCGGIHQKKTNSWHTRADQARAPMDADLDLKKLKKHGFLVENNRLINRDGKDLGELQVLDVKYLYEWAPKEYHEAWIKTGGIDNVYMKRVLEIAPQMLGRGFYISLHPTDSAGYGSTLTVFPVTRPLVILKTSNVDRDVEMLERLGKAGVDALSEYHRSWLAIISSQHLQNPQRASQTLISDWRAEKDLKKVVQAITSYLENSPDKAPTLLLEAFKAKISLSKSFDVRAVGPEFVELIISAIKFDVSPHSVSKKAQFPAATTVFKMPRINPEAPINLSEPVRFGLMAIDAGPTTIGEIAGRLQLQDQFQAFTKAFREAQK